MSPWFEPILSPRRMLAELLAWIDYRKFQNQYWTLRSSDITRRYRYENDFPMIENIIRTTRARRLVDIGCGYGRLFDLYRRMGVHEVIGLDISDSLLEAARHRAEEMEAKGETQFTVKKHDLREPLLDLPSVDLVLSTRVLQHIPTVDIGTSVQSLSRPGVKWVYLSELFTERKTEPYTFVHDYVKLFSTFGFRVSARGNIPVLGHEFLLLAR